MEPLLDTIQTRLGEVRRLEAILHAEKLALIAEADRAGAVFVDGARDLGEWVARHLDEHPRRARELARTARAATPGIVDRLRDGALSPARADAYAAAIRHGMDPAPLEGFDVAGVWRLVRRRRAASPPDRYFVLQPSLGLDHWRAHGRLGAADGALVADALAAEADRIVTGVPPAERASRAERMADALVSVSLGRGRFEPTVTLHVEANPAPFAGIETTAGVAATVGELAEAECTGRIETTTHTPEGRPVHFSRRRRTIPPALRRFVMWRDRHACTVDGCSSTYRLQTHHIVPVAAGGPDTAENLTLLCWYHHHVVIHRRGFTIDPGTPPGRRRLTPAGRSP
jgi:hypothetical protein